MRVFRNCEEMIKEMDRELFQSGTTVEVKHYQNKKLEGNDRFTKELMGVNFCISRPLDKRREMLDFIFKDKSENIERYCQQEFLDRISTHPLNPGNSWKIRQDMWQKFLENDNTKFSYTYSERLYDNWQNIIGALKNDKHTRQAVMQVFNHEDTSKFGGDTRIPCSLHFQYMIRNNQLHCFYCMRSNDFFGHFPIDIWLAAQSIDYLVNSLLETYPDLKPGKLYYQAGSLHAYNWDLKERLLF